ncbi:MAG: hypothetical protein WBD87_11955 [Candidatus Acidiferrales bacterium]
MLTCPNCGYKQSSGDRCQKCSSLFSYYSQSRAQDEPSGQHAAGATPASSVGNAAPAEGFFIPWRTAYRVMSGTSLALLLAVVFLIFHKAAPPQVRIDPQAAARAAAKLSEAQTAAQQNQPHQVTLDSTEVNSYLNSNLQLANGAAKSDATPSAATANPAAAADSAATPAASAEAPAAEPTIDDVQSAVKDVKVDMVGDLVKAYVTFDFHGKDMSLELDGHISSADGYLHFEPTAGELGSLPLPQSTLDAAVDKMMSSPENREKMRLPPGINSIKVVNGQVVVN